MTTPEEPLHILLAIRSINPGGAERQFMHLVRHINKERFRLTVVTMYPGEHDEEVKATPGVSYHCLNKGGRYDVPAFLMRYRKLLKQQRPQVIYSFMSEMNIYSIAAVRLALMRTPVAVGIRASNIDFSHYGRLRKLVFDIERQLARRANLLIANSYRAIEFLRTSGYRMRETAVIHNGIDTELFQFRTEHRVDFRMKYQLTEEHVAVGINSRLFSGKGYPVLAEAARPLLQEYPQLRFFAIGFGDEGIKEETIKVLDDQAERFTWLGRTATPEAIYPGWDIYVSSSLFGEGFSNSIGEAMATGLPCVVTDVGDSKRIVGDTGFSVEHNNAEALREALRKLIEDRPRRLQLGAAARARMETEFSITRLVQNTENTLAGLVKQ